MKDFIKKILFAPSIAKKITRLLAIIHQFSYQYLGVFASVSEGGMHPKHRLMDYHKFFVDNVSKGDSVLDVGCGNGALLKDIAVKSNASVVGVEISKYSVNLAKIRLSNLTNVKLIQSDIREYKEDVHYDTIIMSNILEHIDKREELLRHLNMQFTPKQFLIRVPMFERDWLVPYKKEIGVEWRLDPTHKTEYIEAEFRNELTNANLDIAKTIFRWGEIWAVAVSR